MSNPRLDPATWLHVRPAEIVTYHRTTYDRISPSSKLHAGKTVLITAGAVGIGLAIAESFAKAGAARLILIQRREEELAKAKQTIEANSATKVETYAASVTDFPRITDILKNAGSIDILVANAAISHPFVPSKDVSTEDFKATFDINVVGNFHIIKEFLAISGKTVILTSSAAGQVISPGNVGYGPSKAAVNQMIQHFASEAIDGVRFHAFHPGVIYTDAVAKLVPAETFEWEDVKLPGDFATWLAGPEAEFLSGRFVWSSWDVDELVAMKERIAFNPALLTTTIIL